MAQARSRLAGQMPDGATRLASLHDPDARPIRKGRIDRQAVEFGYKAQVLDNDNGVVVVDYSVECGAAPDGSQLMPAIERVRRRVGRAPRAVTADRGYGQAAVERDLHAAGVRTVRFPARPPPHRPARPPSTAAASASSSSGAPAAKAGSATSNAATAGTAPAWTAGTAQRSGAGTGSSPTTWPRSLPWPADPPQPSSRPAPAPGPDLSTRLFQVEVN